MESTKKKRLTGKVTSDKMDKTIVVVSTDEIRKRRVLLRDRHRTESDVTAIMARQMSDEEKIGMADILIRNDEEELIIPQIMKLHKEFSGT